MCNKNKIEGQKSLEFQICVLKMKKGRTVLEQHEGEQLMTEF